MNKASKARMFRLVLGGLLAALMTGGAFAQEDGKKSISGADEVLAILGEIGKPGTCPESASENAFNAHQKLMGGGIGSFFKAQGNPEKQEAGAVLASKIQAKWNSLSEAEKANVLSNAQSMVHKMSDKGKKDFVANLQKCNAKGIFKSPGVPLRASQLLGLLTALMAVPLAAVAMFLSTEILVLTAVGTVVMGILAAVLHECKR